MKKILLLISVIILVSGCNNSNEEKYQLIKDKFEEALIKQLDATGLSSNNHECDSSTSKNVIIDADLLIHNGLLKREDIKDIDNKEYCDVVAKTYKKDDCGIGYDIYLKCKDYQDEGYYAWDY